jgi:alpha/beta superfamily hydrolase
MPDPVVIPGPRDVRGRVDRPDADRLVVACPPHPRHGGSRSDPRLRAVSDALAPEVGCLRFDYGPWDDGAGERRDATNAVAWAAERFDAVGLFGYSFGAGVALRAASRAPTLGACSVLAPPSDDDILAALDGIDCPGQVVAGERDETVDATPVLARAGELGWAVETLPADHHFVGQRARVAERVADFFEERFDSAAAVD